MNYLESTLVCFLAVPISQALTLVANLKDDKVSLKSLPSGETSISHQRIIIRFKKRKESKFFEEDTHKHQCLAVSAQGIHKQVGQLGVPVRNVVVLVCQSTNNISKRRKTLVDILCLLQAVSGSTGGGESLRTSQINQVQYGGSLLLSVDVVALQLQLEHTVQID